MISSRRSFSLIEKDQRLSVLEFAAAERTKKSKGKLIREKITFCRIGTFPFDKIVAMLHEVIRRAGILFHYNQSLLSFLTIPCEAAQYRKSRYIISSFAKRYSIVKNDCWKYRQLLH